MKGTVSDLRNLGKTRYGGACSAAAYLENFIADNVAWAHLDIAGPALSDESKDHISQGCTGFGVQTLIKYLEHFAASSSSS